MLILLFVSMLSSAINNRGILLSLASIETASKNRLTENTNQGVADSLILKEFFADSVSIGKKGHNKVEISILGNDDSSVAVIRFYAISKNSWSLRNQYSYAHFALMDISAELSDFNGDGLKDLTYVSNTAARSANEIRRLFIYDGKADRLISVINSENYPNLQYNNKLKCIDAFLVYGGSSTVFLRLRGDSLKEFAVVSLDEGLTISTIDKYGNKKTIYSDSTKRPGYIRFSDYKPNKVIRAAECF